MAAQTVATHGRHVRHGATSSNSSLVSYPPVPGSPTLTNPDMILPDYEFDDALDERSRSPITTWDASRSNDMQFHLPLSQNSFITGPITHSTPIIYGNGTMLSDIGEVTEVESVIGTGSRRPSHMSVSDSDVALRSSPTMGTSRIKTRTQVTSRERRSSLDSNSTVTTQGHNAPFTDFEDSASVDDINFQGDDEESMASSYVDGTPAQEPAVRRNGTAPGEERYSTSSLSDRAEQILANAKLRLTTMEDNLSRARNTLFYTPMSDGSTPSPPIMRPATSMRESTIPVGSSQSRIFGETGTQEEHANSGYPQRAASALGVVGGYQQPLTASRSVDALGLGYGDSAYRALHLPLDATFEEMSENEDGRDDEFQSDLRTDGRSHTFGSYIDRDFTRSASVAQVRDLKDQMKDLRGKISSLKEQARADSMKRRSLQSLRTLSPFTHSRWDQGFMEARKSQEAPETGLWQAPWNSTEDKGEDEDEIDRALTEKVPSVKSDSPVEDAPTGKTPDESPVEVQQDIFVEAPQESFIEAQDDNSQEGEEWGGDHDQDEAEVIPDRAESIQYEEDRFTDYESESGESTYHDSLQEPVSHEDREDAFDYEHFFLHSAMGTMSQQRTGRPTSWGSVSSDGSVETTRGPFLSNSRRPSVDTISTINTFATANEGRASRNSIMDETTETIVEAPEDSDGAFRKRKAFGGFRFPRSRSSSRNNSVDYHNGLLRRPVIHRSSQSAGVIARHRPSVSSFESTGTNRSFPLVNKTSANGVVTPTESTPGGSPDAELEQISESLMRGAAGGSNGAGYLTVQGLAKEDQILVERLVASLGKCVLGLSEASKASTEARMYRRRIDMARPILEGLEN